MSNSAFSSGERRHLEEPDRLCEFCMAAEQTAPDGLCDDCYADRASADHEAQPVHSRNALAASTPATAHASTIAKAADDA